MTADMIYILYRLCKNYYTHPTSYPGSQVNSTSLLIEWLCSTLEYAPTSVKLTALLVSIMLIIMIKINIRIRIYIYTSPYIYMYICASGCAFVCQNTYMCMLKFTNECAWERARAYLWERERQKEKRNNTLILREREIACTCECTRVCSCVSKWVSGTTRERWRKTLFFS